MKKLFLILIIILSDLSLVHSQSGIQWEKSFGGSNDDIANSIQQTTDGGYIIAGSTISPDGDITGYRGDVDCWIVKTDNSGNLLWQKSLGGTNHDEALSIQQTNDHGYIFVGRTGSSDVDVYGNHGGTDYWVVKLDSNGIILWQKCLGGSNVDEATSVIQTSDGGFVVAGNSLSNDGDVTGNHGSFDYWIVKLDNAGVIIWQRSLGGSDDDRSTSIQSTNDGGYIVAGYTRSNNGEVSGNHSILGFYDYWIVKLDSTGIIHWQKTFGGSNSDQANSIKQTSDGGFIVAGISASDDSNVTLNHGSEDYWIVKLDRQGTMQWQKSFGGTNIDWANSIIQTSDGGYLVGGNSNSIDGDVIGLHGTYFSDYWILKLDSFGNRQWQKIYGGTYDEELNCLQKTNDGGYILAGYSGSNDGDVTGHHGVSSNDDFWIVKLSPSVNVNEIQNPLIDFNINPNPFSTETKISFSLASAEKIKIEIRDIEGRIIRDLDSENLISGEREINWDATDDNGNKVCEGVYFVTVISDNICQTKKVEVLGN